MAIDSIQPGKKSAPGTPRRKVNTSASASAPEFADQLGEALEVEKKQALDPLLEDIDSTSLEFGKRPNQENLKKYRKAVGSFLDYVLKQAYKLDETYSTVRGGKTKVHLKIEIIDEKLEKIADMVLREQAEGLMVLKKLDEIRGMIFDLYK